MNRGMNKEETKQFENARQARKELLEAATPLMKYLAEKHHPHTSVLVDCGTANVIESLFSVGTDEFLEVEENLG